MCLNARPLAGVLKKLPCKLNQVEELLPFLTPDQRVVISDDSSGNFSTELSAWLFIFSGFLHVFMSPRGQRLCGIHLGDQKFAFRGMPFGVPRFSFICYYPINSSAY